MTKNIHFLIISGSFLLRMRTLSNGFVKKIKTYIICSVIIFSKILRENVENFCRTGQAIYIQRGKLVILNSYNFLYIYFVV